MQQHPFGRRSGFQVAPVSMGTMRLPADGADAIGLIRHAIDSGMRYIDASRGYGESEFVLGRALRDGYRDKVILSSKSSPWNMKVSQDDDGSADSIRRRIDEALLRLDVDYLDFYQVWNIESPETWEIATKPGGAVEGIRRAMDEGLVRHAGFTTHETPENLLRYLDQADWCEILLVTYHLLDLRYAPVLQAAHERGIGTAVMNPVGGGKLAEASGVLMKLAESVGAVSVADLAVRFVLSNPNVDTILCGMSKPADVDDTIASADRPPFTAEQLASLRDAMEALSRKTVGFCTACKYCLPCPTGINIPQIMGAIYEERFLGLMQSAKRSYRGAGHVKADACTRCGECEGRCTQKLGIMEEMAYAAAQYADTP